jgi:Ca-activated chloride channel family protein
VSFDWPLALVALLAVPALLAFALAIRRRPSRHPVVYTNLEVLASVVGRRRSWRPWAPVALLLLALTLATTALARPHANLTTQVDNATVVLLVDVSGSMQAADIEPTRLDAAKAAIRTFLDRAPAGFNVGLVPFSTRPHVLAGPTHDREEVREAVAYLSPEEGTAIGDSLAVATTLVRRSVAEEQALSPAADRIPGAIVLLSDGDQTHGRRRPAAGAELARRAGIRVHTVALGTEKGVVPGPGSVLLPVSINTELMTELADQTGGTTFTARTADELNRVFGDLGTSIGRETTSREITSWLLLTAAVALGAALALGRLLAGALSD